MIDMLQPDLWVQALQYLLCGHRDPDLQEAQSVLGLLVPRLCLEIRDIPAVPERRGQEIRLADYVDITNPK